MVPAGRGGGSIVLLRLTRELNALIHTWQDVIGGRSEGIGIKHMGNENGRAGTGTI